MLRFGRFALPIMTYVWLNMLVNECEMSIYPGLRRRPMHSQLMPQQPLDVSADFLAQLMEENARRRLQQQFEQQLELINMQRSRQRQHQEYLRERIRQQQIQLQLQQQQQRQQQQQQQQLRDLNSEEDDVDYANINNNNNNKNNIYEQYDNVNGEFSFKYPKYSLDDKEKLLGQQIPFAVSPLDPRFYAEDADQNVDLNGEESDDADELDSKALEEYEEYVPAEASKPADGALSSSSIGGNAGIAKDSGANILAPAPVLAPAPMETSKLLDTSPTFHRIKPQTAAAAAVAGVNIKQTPTAAGQNNNNMRHDISALIDKLQKEGKSGAVLNQLNEASLSAGQDVDRQQIVLRQHLGMDSEMGMYLVALIAGVSAATTVGLIALGIAWVHNKAKAAADVEYPAYGVTGPNKDISPSGDRKLAQSAQMYHYQHQKQQIIAMENRQAAEGSCGLSDVESDDDNEEGDYTVYECPGLAPTGEMEVKNPLFLDETPMTPSTGNTAPNVNNNITQATPQQPPQQQLGKKGTNKNTTSAATSANTSSEGKNTKTKKQDKK